MDAHLVLFQRQPSICGLIEGARIQSSLSVIKDAIFPYVTHAKNNPFTTPSGCYLLKTG